MIAPWSSIRLPLALLVGRSPTLGSMVQAALRVRFGSSVFGLLWIVIYPAIFLAIYGLVYVRILEVRAPGLTTGQYLLSIFCGLVPFLAFSEAIATGGGSIVANRGLVKNTLVPIELVVARDVLVPHVGMLVGLGLVAIAAFASGGPWWGIVLAVVIVPLQILMTLGLAWLLSALLVFFRDLQQAIPISVLCLMLISPIAYTAAMVPGSLKFTLYLNPLAWTIEAYRAALLEGRLEISLVAPMAGSALLSLTIGFHVLNRLKTMITDHV